MGIFGGFFITTKWRMPKLVIAFFILEFVFTIPALVLYAVADPNSYRTKLWQDGANNGFNSSPKMALYAAANYQPFDIAPVWSQWITTYNVIVSVLITFLMLTKAVMFILHIWVPLISFLVHATCMILFAYSAHVQTSPDMTDPEHPQPGAPWYIERPCSTAYYPSNIPWCQQAKAAFAITLILTIIFGANAVWALYCCWPTREEREERRIRKEEEEEEKALEKWNPEDWSPQGEDDATFEMNEFSKGKMADYAVPMTPMTPMTPSTPRTMAFRKLGGGRDLPLRA